METKFVRSGSRALNELRTVEIKPGVNPYAEGSVEVSFGNTKVHVTASIEEEVPRWMKDQPGGWITAEYGMLPRSTHTRNRREAASGKQGGRTLEIQRLIGRSLRAAVDLRSLPPVTIKVDCDVLVADGGTRTASISGAWVALALALRKLEQSAQTTLALKQIAAVSLGKVGGEICLDLSYEEDSNADFDLNLVFNEDAHVIEVQGTAEGAALTREEFSALLDLGEAGAETIFAIQRQALER